MTGGAGSIVSHLTKEFVKRGHSVVVLDSSQSEEENLNDLANSGFMKFIGGYVRGRETVSEELTL